MKATGPLPIALLLLFCCATAQADIPPPDDYVETCTEDIQEVEGTSCDYCAFEMGDRSDCEDLESAEGAVKVCTRGTSGSFHDEMWCTSDGSRSDDEITAEREDNETTARGGGGGDDEDSCQVVSFRRHVLPSGALLVTVVIGVALLVRRRVR